MNCLRDSTLLAFATSQCLVLGFGACSRGSLPEPQPETPSQLGIADAAYPLIHDRVTFDQIHALLYQDMDSGFSRGFLSGIFASDPVALQKIHLDAACIDDPASDTGCTDDRTVLDREHGTVLRISIDPLMPGEYVGLNIEEPEGWGAAPRGVGYDLRGATHVLFDVRVASPTLGANARFGVGGRTGAFVHIPQTTAFSTMSVPFASLGLTDVDLADAHVLFTVATNDWNAPLGGVLLLDNIRLDPVPTAWQAVPGFPIANQTFGVAPVEMPDPGRVPIPMDQLLRNVATTYESACAIMALTARSSGPDLADAVRIADAAVYALERDNSGMPLPVAPDGSRCLHSAYMAGALPLFNDQNPGSGLKGEVRLAGFTASPQLCGGSGFCLVLDGATGGNNALIANALIAVFAKTGDARYLDAARNILRWIVSSLSDTGDTGYGGYFIGYPDQGVAKILQKSKSVENAADIFSACTTLGRIEQELGNTADAAQWIAVAEAAGDFCMSMYDHSTGHWHAGTVPLGTSPGPGIEPTGPQKGDDVVNIAQFLDASTFAVLALAESPRYRDQIDWRRPVQYVLDNFAQTVNAGGQEFRGFSIVRDPLSGPRGIAWEFTAQVVVAARLVDRLYQESRFEEQAAFYLNEIRRAQLLAPFGDQRGLVASTLQDGNLLPPLEQCLSTPFQCIPARVGLAATAWAVFAERDVNLLSPLPFSPSDFNGDGRVDSEDLSLFASCSAGPAVPTFINTLLCKQADFDHDNDVDQSDFAILQRCYTGLGIAADPGCID